MTNEVIAEGSDIIETPTINNKVIQWKVTLVGPFVVGRCGEVLPGYTSIVEDVTDNQRSSTGASTSSSSNSQNTNTANTGNTNNLIVSKIFKN